MTEVVGERLTGGRLVRASVQSVGAAMGAQLLLVVSGPLLARLLGVENRGYLAALNAFGIMAVWLGTLGIPTACSFHVSTHPEQMRAVARSAVRLFAIQAPVVTGLLAVAVLLWGRGKSSDIHPALYLTLLFAPAALAHAYALALLQGRQRFTAYNVLAVFPIAIYAGGVVTLFVLGEHRLFVVVAVWVAGLAVGAVVASVVALAGLPPGIKTEPSLGRRLLRFGLRAHLGHLSPVETLPIDQAVVGALLSPAALGLYAVANGFTNLLRFSAQSVGMVAYPAVAVRGPTSEAWRLLWRFVIGVAGLTAVVSVVLAAAAPELVRFLFGESFHAATPIARLLIVATALSSVRRIILEGLRGLGHPGTATLAEVAMYPWLLAVGPYALIRYGPEGLAGTLAVGYGFSLVLSLALALRLQAQTQPGLSPPALSVPAAVPQAVPGVDR
jgi:O-antigen/teichoic acid export membrane protein